MSKTKIKNKNYKEMEKGYNGNIFYGWNNLILFSKKKIGLMGKKKGKEACYSDYPNNRFSLYKITL